MSSESLIPDRDEVPRVDCFRILDLSRELRDKIYRDLLTPDNGLHEHKSFDMTPSLLRANKQIHDEAANVLYH